MSEITVEMLGIKNEREEALAKAWWNLAIEAAAKVAEQTSECDTSEHAIRKLKK